MRHLSSLRSEPKWHTPNNQKQFKGPHSGGASQGDPGVDLVESDTPHHKPDQSSDWTVKFHAWPQEKLLDHVAEQKKLLLQFLKGGVGNQPGNQLAADLKGLIDTISCIEDHEARNAQLRELNSVLVEQGVTSIIGGHEVFAYLSQVIADDFFKYGEPGKIQEYVADEVQTLEMLATQTTVPFDYVIAECKTLLGRINVVPDLLARAALIRKVFDWVNSCCDADPARFVRLLTEAAGAVDMESVITDEPTVLSPRNSGPTQAEMLEFIHGKGLELAQALNGHVDGNASGQVAPDADLRVEFDRLLQAIEGLSIAEVKNQRYAELTERLVQVTRNQALAKEFLVSLAKERNAVNRTAGVASAAKADIESVSSIARDYPKIAGLVQSLAGQELFRGLTTTSEGYFERAVLDDGTVQWRKPDASEAGGCFALDDGRTLQTLQDIQASGKAFMPLLWGFRAFDPAQGLFAKEVNTMKAYASMAQSFQGSVEIKAPLVLADIHAEHNKIPPKIYEPYYLAVERKAQELGVQTIRLSTIYRQLDITLEGIEGLGPALVQKTGGNAGNTAVKAMVELPGKYWAHLKKQANHTVARFPGVFEVPKGYKPSEKFYGDKALHYAQFRASEGVHVLPRLAELREANGAPVLVAHVADPSSGLVGVNGLYIRAKDNANNTVTAIPWGKPEEASAH